MEILLERSMIPLKKKFKVFSVLHTVQCTISTSLAVKLSVRKERERKGFIWWGKRVAGAKRRKDLCGSYSLSFSLSISGHGSFRIHDQKVPLDPPHSIVSAPLKAIGRGKGRKILPLVYQ